MNKKFNTPHINSSEALERLDGDVSLFKEILEIYLNEPQYTNEKLKQLLQDEKYEESAKLIHLLKGISGNIGAKDLYNQCQLLENILRKKTEGDINSIAEKIYKLFDITMEELNYILKQL